MWVWPCAGWNLMAKEIVALDFERRNDYCNLARGAKAASQ